jgi:hypothetical protein
MFKVFFQRLGLFSAVVCLGFGLASEDAVTLRGYLSDDGCGLGHNKTPGTEKTVACVQSCVKDKHHKPILIVDEHIMQISNPKRVTDFLGRQVAVIGTVKGGVILVIKVSLDVSPNHEKPGQEGGATARIRPAENPGSEIGAISKGNIGRGTEEWQGTLSDEKCGAAHANASEKSAACAQKCVKGGAAPVFVTSDGKVLKIANAEAVTDHIGRKVELTGDLIGDTITVVSVKMQ